ncbi:accessory gene regulator B family protein [Paenibacillus sp. NPDC057967]|uniref:accessory gene regulator B family protein n=1 Tax=Paenibacillus sp. NPDC057967 TaxID=3346293 RepID=UPI0036DCEFEC
MRISVLATRLAEGIVKEAPEFSNRVGRIRHTLVFLLNIVPIILLTTIIGLVTGRLIEMWTVLLSFAILRQVSGGIHMGTSEMCILVTTIGATVLSFAEFHLAAIHIMTSISLILVLIYAPSRIEGRTLFPKKYFKYLKIAAAILILSNFFIQSSVIAAAFLAQSFMIIRLKGDESG